MQFSISVVMLHVPVYAARQLKNCFAGHAACHGYVFGTHQCNQPLPVPGAHTHASGPVAPVAAVVLPSPQDEQGAWLPPALKVPRGHTPQLGPPAPDSVHSNIMVSVKKMTEEPFKFCCDA